MACGNGKVRQVDEPYDGGHGIGIDTATIHQIDSIDEEGVVLKQQKGSLLSEPLANSLLTSNPQINLTIRNVREMRG